MTAVSAPELQFFMSLYAVVVDMTLMIVFLGFLFWMMKRCCKPSEISFDQADL